MPYSSVLKGKLVRDKIAEIIRAKGQTAQLRILSPHERQMYLEAKLFEEVHELVEAKSRSSATEEMADVIEVLRTIARSQGISWEEVERAEREKRRLRGGFRTFLCLVPTVSPE